MTSVSVLFTPIPLLYLVIVGVVITLTMRIRFRSNREAIGSILEYADARFLVALCAEPQTTASLRAHYVERKRLDPIKVLGGMRFDNYLKGLEKEGHLVYTRTDGRWRATEEAFAIIEKYGGEVYRK